MSQIQLSELRNWLRKSLSSNLSHAERQREKLITEIARSLNSLKDFCGQLSRKAEEDMESKRDNRALYRAARGLVRLTNLIAEMCQSLTIPNTADTAALRKIQRDVSRLASESAQAREEWLRQIRPFYIIDMMTLGGNIDKNRRLADELHTFLMGPGSLLRSLEELDEKLDSINELRTSLLSTKAHRDSIENKVAEAETEEKRIREEIDGILGNPRIKEYLEIDRQLRSLRGELLHTGFSRLGRPLRKLIAVSERGNYPVAIELREIAKDYVSKPFSTFLGEEDGYPKLKSVMAALSNAVSSGKLEVKQREAKKVLERTNQVVSGESLATIHASSKQLKRTYDKLLADMEIAGKVKELRDLRQKRRANHTTQEELRKELQRELENQEKLEEHVSSALKQLEAFARRLSGNDVKIQLS